MEQKPSSTPQEDIAYLRALAEDAKSVPLVSGPYMLAAGIVFAIASFASWWVSVMPGTFPPFFYSLIWIVASVVFVAFLAVGQRIIPSLAKKQSDKALVNRLAGMVWSAVGYGCLTLFFGTYILAYRLHTPIVWLLMPSGVMIFYSIGWMTTAAISRKPVINILSAGSLLAALVLALISGTSLTFPIYVYCWFY